MRPLLITITGLLLFLSSCTTSKRAFTKSTFVDNNWTKEELQHVQFYLSDDIVLWRELDEVEKTVTNGDIKLVDGQRVEQVRFRRGLPGVFLFSPKYSHFAIGFEEDSDNYLMFGPSPKAGDQYVLLAKDWKRDYGVVRYAGKEWKTSFQSAYARLLVKMDHRRRVQIKSKKAKGRTVN